MERGYLLVLMTLLVELCFGELPLYTVEREMSAKISELENTVMDLKIQLDSMKYDNADNDPRRISKRSWKSKYDRTNGFILGQRGIGNNVAFSAMLADSVTLQKGESVIFDTTTTNIGGAYNPKTGIFTVPVSGVYVFSLNIACDTGNYVEAAIMKVKGSRALLNSICKNNSSFEIHQNGGSTVVELNHGDEIYVQMVWPSTPGTLTGRGLSLFSGFLLST